MAVITLLNTGNILEYTRIVNFKRYSNLLDDIAEIPIIEVHFPSNNEYKQVFRNNNLRFEINIEGERYNYILNASPSIGDEEIICYLTTNIFKKLNSTFVIDSITDRQNLNKAVYNPVLWVQKVLEYLGIKYNKYQFTTEIEYLNKLSINLTNVCYPQGGVCDILLDEFISEVLKRVGIKFYYDFLNEEVCLYNVIRAKTLFNNLLNPDMIYNKTETESDLYYNSYSISTYPLFTAKSYVEYSYEIEINGNKVFVHQDYFNSEDYVYGTAAEITSNIYIDNVLFVSGQRGVLTGNYKRYNAGLSDDVIYLCEMSKEIYNQTVEWAQSDSFVSNASSLLAFETLEGAQRVGNDIIRHLWRKRKQYQFKYPEKTELKVGDELHLYNKTFVVVNKYYDEDMTTENILIEERIYNA